MSSAKHSPTKISPEKEINGGNDDNKMDENNVVINAENTKEGRSDSV